MALMVGNLLGACIWGWLGYVSGIATIPFLLARSCIRVRATHNRVRLRALDASAMFYSGFVLSGPGVAVLVAVTGSVALAILLTLFLWLGFRLNLVVTNNGVTVTRRFLYLIPWWFRRRANAAQPTAFVDGWGDFADPEALHVVLWEDGPSLELAWGDANSGDKCEDLAREFNAAVSWLSVQASSAN